LKVACYDRSGSQIQTFNTSGAVARRFFWSDDVEAASSRIRRKGGHGIHGCAEEGVRYSHARHRLPLVIGDSHSTDVMPDQATRATCQEQQRHCQHGQAPSVREHPDQYKEEAMDELHLDGPGYAGPDEVPRLYMGFRDGGEVVRVHEARTGRHGPLRPHRRPNLQEVRVANIAGSGLAALGMHVSAAGMLQIAECRVRTVSSKGKLTVMDKLVGSRSPEEITFLDDIVMFVVHSGARGDEELTGWERPDGSRLVLSSRAVRDELKATVKEEGLPELYFSSIAEERCDYAYAGSRGQRV
jgi:hypothetical protein